MKKTLRFNFLLPVLTIFSFNITGVAQGEYCSPSFANGCSLWNTASVSLDSIAWSNSGTDCNTSDYTSLSTTLNAGESVVMNVTSGVWCGCAVWLDLNQDFVFDDAENLHYEYVGGDPSYSYDFEISVPLSTPTGAYRLRVISPWGSDGFSTTGTNGYGGCGSYQYGNFQDFTVNVVNSSAVLEPVKSYLDFVLYPNPAINFITIDSAGLETGSLVKVADVLGNIVLQAMLAPKGQLDISTLSSGVYSVVVISGHKSAVNTLVKV